MILDWIIRFLLKNGLRGSLFLAQLFNRQFVYAVNKHGVKMMLDPREYVEKEIIANGYYEEEVIDYLTNAGKLNDRPVFWDIGANVGLHGLTFKKCIPHAHVCSFEPYHYNFKKLEGNEAINEDIQLQKFNFGLAGKLEVNKMYTSSGNAGRTSFLNLEDSVDVAIYSLSCTGDYLVEQNIAPAPNVIKIDVEGMELPVLTGCKNILQNPGLHTIIFEGPANINKNHKLIQLLKSFGFEISVIPRKINLIETNENYLAFRKQKQPIVKPSSQNKAKA